MYHEAPRTPLRRGSQRFLAESKPFISSTTSTGSRDGGTASGLAALEDSFQGIADEIEVFVRNMEQMEKITERLEESADIMAMFLQAQRMNTFCVEFPQVSLTS
jgi:DASH complex subunit DAM1